MAGSQNYLGFKVTKIKIAQNGEELYYLDEMYYLKKSWLYDIKEEIDWEKVPVNTKMRVWDYNDFEPNKRNRRGDRFYKKGFAQWIPCGSIIRSLTLDINMRWSGQYYQLSSELNKHIEQYGDITY